MLERHDKERIIPIEIYTDGSLKKVGQNLTFGGWAYIAIRDGEKIYYDFGSEANTTSQRMELLAIVNALKYAQSIRRNVEKVIIYSDSAYAVNCYLQEWYIKWQSNGWVSSQGIEVANKDLWREIIPFFDNFWYDFRKVKGHNGVIYNEECDQLAQMEADKLKHNWRGIKNNEH